MEDMRFTIQTDSKRDMNLMLNAERMALALYELLEWRRILYNCKDYGDCKYLYKGKLYDENEFSKIEIPDEEYNENFTVKDLKSVYTRETIERRLNQYLDDVADLIYNTYNE